MYDEKPTKTTPQPMSIIGRLEKPFFWLCMILFVGVFYKALTTASASPSLELLTRTAQDAVPIVTTYSYVAAVGCAVLGLGMLALKKQGCATPLLLSAMIGGSTFISTLIAT